LDLMNSYQQYIYRSRYARWNEEEKRREEWDETVQRYMDNVVGSNIDSEAVYNEVREAIQNLEVMPSMRAMMTAGPALERDNTCGYNCSYLPIDDIKSFDEAMFILLCGTGVGFSAERQYVNKLPEVPDRLFDSETVIAVKDSKEGWAKALRQLISLLYSGEIPRWDTSRVRAAGTRLKTFGGRASGPEPLVELFRFIIAVFKGAIGRKLTSLECHDILCKIGEVVVVGGVRRSAMISLSNLSDDRMRHAKTGQWWIDNGQRALSNNSAVYTEKPDAETFLREWTSLVESKSGERGIFSRYASQNCTRTFAPRRDCNQDFGTNPCSEIILRPYQFC
jgi:ribonucleoside-triphosphate reductase